MLSRISDIAATVRYLRTTSNADSGGAESFSHPGSLQGWCLDVILFPPAIGSVSSLAQIYCVSLRCVFLDSRYVRHAQYFAKHVEHLVNSVDTG